MPRRWAVGIAIAGLLLALFVVAALAQMTESGEVADSLVLETQDMKPKDLKPGVGLSHLKHSVDYKIACTDCHHDYQDGKNIWQEGEPVKKCIECHDMLKTAGKTKKYKLAMHANCQGCHKDLEKAGKPTGPGKKCKECHTGQAPE